MKLQDVFNMSESTVFQCVTQLQATEFLRTLLNEDRVSTVYWDVYKENTCYELSEGIVSYGSTGHFLDNGYSVARFNGWSD
ncbi:hypothetical protein SAMN05446037_1006117 [Anaerovirgula multivorans]|uniref:Uncharacterized protein n=1 Tax=Anaerovirgula multivorans TaxID=312168 RepID=A0A239CRB0_9FIRM|nr:hypothetical protein [Anaerovirgula multivorans]SNS22796.1 hypothetical protein SAMN05446037_1006117 [Anaerovirgula multivorans]